jgi:hypothetical protein
MGLVEGVWGASSREPIGVAELGYCCSQASMANGEEPSQRAGSRAQGLTGDHGMGDGSSTRGRRDPSWARDAAAGRSARLGREEERLDAMGGRAHSGGCRFGDQTWAGVLGSSDGHGDLQGRSSAASKARAQGRARGSQ